MSFCTSATKSARGFDEFNSLRSCFPRCLFFGRLLATAVEAPTLLLSRLSRAAVEVVTPAKDSGGSGDDDELAPPLKDELRSLLLLLLLLLEEDEEDEACVNCARVLFCPPPPLPST